MSGPEPRRRARANEALPEDLPQNAEAERALLGSLLLCNDLMAEVAPLVQAEHFYWLDHQEVFRAIAGLIADGKPATAITVKSFLPPEFAGMPVLAYLAAVCTEACVPASAAGYAQIIRQLATRRNLVGTADRLAAAARTAPIEISVADMIEAAETDLLAARTAAPASHLASMSAAEGGAWMLERIESLRAGLERSSAISTGIADLDRATSGGFQRGQLWLMAGRPGMGKTVAMTSLSRYAAREAGVLVFQCEVTRDQQWARYLADLAYVHNRPLPFGAIMKGRDLDDEDVWRLEDAQKRLAQLHLRVECEPGVSVAQIAFAVKAEKKRLAQRGLSLGVVFIDYLKFVKVSDRYRGNRVLEIGEISGALKTLAKAEDICVVLLAQLNRQVEAEGRADRRPTVADLRDSGELEQDADVVLLLYRDAFYLEKKVKGSSDPDLQTRYFERLHSLEIILGKNRAGPTSTLDLWCDVAASTIAQHARGPA
ncbi:replicative DNA helicase [Methylobacterium oxalidis]|uniref:DNA 5'-3' helicase n=1 Tax=Methylobacterium oxalidis TaxID=944322 RepID=A0A512J902_9HYPH|nr:DnaB-like helicase C-terminal domain-containing protein [Methylobacterium oxalidis]GEP06436.1 replicative DNA helicase [Methylobacterium oxalidis]GJE33538.1 Replicative DNA helicase [Methylobacterium oxalidis]GLS65476.1 replicative DNA helicase [Methylobacterium oxalidis]